MARSGTIIFRAAAVRDAAGVSARPGAVAVRRGRVIRAGAYDDIPWWVRRKAATVDLPDRLLIPALVNGHTHLDLTGMGPRPLEGDFADWLRMVIEGRPTQAEAVSSAVRQGLRLSLESGVGRVGDVAGSVSAIEARLAVRPPLSLPGVTYLESLGQGHDQLERFQQAAEAVDALPFETPVPGRNRGVVLGLAPHAPYSTGKQVYTAAALMGHRRIFRLSTHLAESPEELQFVRDATGPLAELLKSLGRWGPWIEPTGKHPIDLLAPELKRGRWLLAHCNQVEDRHIQLLAKTGNSVAYCPVASDYFGFTGDGPGQARHRYRDMLEAGVNVCLGTDSILCQPPDEPQPLGIVPQMRRLYQRDGTDAELLLSMGTTRGMVALEMHESDATLSKGAPALFCSVPIDPDDATDPLEQVLRGRAVAQTLDATGG